MLCTYYLKVTHNSFETNISTELMKLAEFVHSTVTDLVSVRKDVLHFDWIFD